MGSVGNWHSICCVLGDADVFVPIGGCVGHPNHTS